VWEGQTKPIRDQMNALLEPVRKKLRQQLYSAFAPDVQATVDKPAAERTPLEQWIAHRAQPFLDLVDEKEPEKALKGDDKTKFDALKQELAKYDSLNPGDPPVASYMTEVGRVAPPTFAPAVGNFEKPVRGVQPGFLTVLNPPAPNIQPPGFNVNRPPHRARQLDGRSCESSHAARHGEPHLATFRNRHRGARVPEKLSGAASCLKSFPHGPRVFDVPVWLALTGAPRAITATERPAQVIVPRSARSCFANDAPASLQSHSMGLLAPASMKNCCPLQDGPQQAIRRSTDRFA
jgi:hypothetical protein